MTLITVSIEKRHVPRFRVLQRDTMMRINCCMSHHCDMPASWTERAISSWSCTTCRNFPINQHKTVGRLCNFHCLWHTIPSAGISDSTGCLRGKVQDTNHGLCDCANQPFAKTRNETLRENMKDFVIYNTVIMLDTFNYLWYIVYALCIQMV
jgi:hypothetical protein